MVDFGYVPNGEHAHFNLELQNVSSLNVYYHWEWDENECYIFELPPLEV